MSDEMTLDEYRARYVDRRSPSDGSGRTKRPVRDNPPAEREQDLMNAIIALLRLRGCVAIRVNSGAVPVEGERGRRLIRMAAAGTSDILAVMPPNGRMLACEVKIGRNTTTPAQEAFLSEVERVGGVAIVAYSVDDVIQVLDVEARR